VAKRHDLEWHSRHGYLLTVGVHFHQSGEIILHVLAKKLSRGRAKRAEIWRLLELKYGPTHSSMAVCYISMEFSHGFRISPVYRSNSLLSTEQLFSKNAFGFLSKLHVSVRSQYEK
jgi:hypothetical protein